MLTTLLAGVVNMMTAPPTVPVLRRPANIIFTMFAVFTLPTTSEQSDAVKQAGAMAPRQH